MTIYNFSTSSLLYDILLTITKNKKMVLLFALTFLFKKNVLELIDRRDACPTMGTIFRVSTLLSSNFLGAILDRQYYIQTTDLTGKLVNWLTG